MIGGEGDAVLHLDPTFKTLAPAISRAHLDGKKYLARSRRVISFAGLPPVISSRGFITGLNAD
jgi:hypothetical protein